jgi:uncharacterized integral membrane protein
MNAKTIFIIIISALVTSVLMKNTDEIDFWFFGDASVPKLAVLGIMFFAGAIVGFVLGRPRKKQLRHEDDELEDSDHHTPGSQNKNTLSDEDREYIS